MISRALFSRALGVGRVCRNLALYRPFTVLGPNQNKTYNLENHLKPFALNALWNIRGAKPKKKILGRGPGCKHGKQSGRGTKGQGQRGNKKHPRFEAANAPLYIRIPKYGLKKSRRRHDEVNIGKVAYFIKKGWLDPQETITIKKLYDAGIIRKPKWGLKLLAGGIEKLTQPLKFEISSITLDALNKLKEKGCEITIKYRTPLKLREHIFPDKFPLPLKEPIPPQNEVRKLEKYRDLDVKLEYNQPAWVAKMLADSKKIENENQALQKQMNFQFPVTRYPGMGADRIRKRKQPMSREFKFKFESSGAGAAATETK